MADLSLVTDNFFATASETFTDNLSGSISAGAVTVPVNSGVEYATGEVVVLTVDPGTASEATFIGEKDTTNQFINCIWTEGNTAVGHDAGATIIDYDSATHFNALSKGVQQFANQDGSLITQAVRDALGLTSGTANGWEVAPYTFSVASGYNSGERNFSVTVANADVSDEYSEGMRFKFTRNTTAPTQCADLEASSTQFASRASGSVTGTISTMTDDFSMEAWLKPESYVAGGIASRYDGTSGWIWNLSADLTMRFIADQGANTDNFSSYLALQLGVWSHVAVTCDSSGNAYTMYINGISVTVVTLTTAATAIVQAGPLQIGAFNSTTPYDGKICEVRVWNAIRTQTQIRDNMWQQLVGTETNLVGYWKLNGDFNDSTTAANHLTGSGGAVATNVDNPFHDVEYVTVMSVTYSAPNTTIVFHAPSGYGIPNMTLTQPYYSAQNAPYGYPAVDTNMTNTKTAMNITAITVTNADQNLGSSGGVAGTGIVVLYSVAKKCKALVTVGLVIGSTADFEFRPQIRVNGTTVQELDAMAAPGIVSSRATERTLTAEVILEAGDNLISAGVFLSSGVSLTLPVGGAFITAKVDGDVAC